MITINVNVSDHVREMLVGVIDALTGQDAIELSEQSGMAARNAAIKYHREFDQAGGWRGKRYLGPSKNDGSSFGSEVTGGWALQSFSANEAVISNNATYYAFKVTGGTITPKRAKFLTIPLIAEAKGVKAFRYQEETGKRLFRPKGKNVLMESTGKGTARAVYALVSSVTQDPWPNALPPEELIGDAFMKQYRKGLEEIVEKL